MALSDEVIARLRLFTTPRIDFALTPVGTRFLRHPAHYLGREA
jgi:hypothetical protein